VPTSVGIRIRGTEKYVRRAADLLLRGPVVPGSGPEPDRRDPDEEAGVANHVYRLSEIVGSSPTSVDDAVRTAIRKASETVRNIEWFQTQEIRGHVEDGEIAHFQVTLKIGFRVD
jgi:flavin-binding protein dodecin